MHNFSLAPEFPDIGVDPGRKLNTPSGNAEELWGLARSLLRLYGVHQHDLLPPPLSKAHTTLLGSTIASDRVYYSRSLSLAFNENKHATLIKVTSTRLAHRHNHRRARQPCCGFEKARLS